MSSATLTCSHFSDYRQLHGSGSPRVGRGSSHRARLRQYPLFHAKLLTKGLIMSFVKFEQIGAVGHLILCNLPENQLGRHWADDLRCAVHEAT
jgi:hypothetical protein